MTRLDRAARGAGCATFLLWLPFWGIGYLSGLIAELFRAGFRDGRQTVVWIAGLLPWKQERK